MSNTQKLIICIVIAFLCFLPSPKPLINVSDLSAEEFEAYGYAGLFAYMDGAKTEDKVEKPIAKDCKCRGTKKISYDGGGSLVDCPCVKGDCDCGCMSKNPSGDAVGDSGVEADKKKKVRMILITDPPNCGPCRDLEKTLLATLRSKKYQDGGWTIGNKETDTIQVLTLSNPDDMKIIQELDVSYLAIPAFVRYGSEDDNLVGNVHFDTFLKYFHGGTKTPYYTQKTKSPRWQLNKTFSPTKSDLLYVLRSQKKYVDVWSMPLEVLSREDLTLMYSDVMNGNYNKIEWR